VTHNPQTTQMFAVLSPYISLFVVGKHRDFKFGIQVARSQSQHTDYKLSLKGAWLRHVTDFKFGTPSISYEWLKLELSNFVHRLAISSLTKRMKNHSQKGHGYGHVTYLNS